MKARWLWLRLRRDWWRPVPCGWPYIDGYATFNPRRNTIMDTRLSKRHAQEICNEMNSIMLAGPQRKEPPNDQARD